MMKIYNTLFSNTFSAKKFSLYLFAIILMFFTFHTSIWFVFTKQILDAPENIHIGDLVRLNYAKSSLHLRSTGETNLSSQHMESKDWSGQNIDIITLGDSFSNGQAGGRNPYYQDYIQTLYGTKVLNIPPATLDKNYIERVISLYHNGLLDQMNPKLIIISSVERSVIPRFSKKIDWAYTTTPKESLESFKHSVFVHNKSRSTSIINKGNYNFVLNPLLYALFNKPIQRAGVYKLPLKQDLFSIQAANTLLFYKDDIESLSNNTEHEIMQVNANLNHLADLLQKKKIKLAFMPTVDKYDLYSSYIKNNPFKENTFFEQMRDLKKSYYFIDTKAILKKQLPKTKDLYYADDTHWNFYASEKIFQQTPIDQLLKCD